VFAHRLKRALFCVAHARWSRFLRSRRHIVDDLGPHEENFDPGHDAGGASPLRPTREQTPAKSKSYVSAAAAEGLVLVFPVWFDGLPAICRDISSACFSGRRHAHRPRGLFHPNLQHIQAHVLPFAAYGESRLGVTAKKDPARRFVRDNITRSSIERPLRVPAPVQHGLQTLRPASRIQMKRVNPRFRKLVSASEECPGSEAVFGPANGPTSTTDTISHGALHSRPEVGVKDAVASVVRTSASTL